MTEPFPPNTGSWRGIRVIAIAVAAVVVCLIPVSLKVAASRQMEEHPAGGSLLALDGYKLTFDEHFAQLDISDRPGTGAAWYSHTPWAGDFGDARFVGPGPGGAFAAGNEGLDIIARKGPDGAWTSGLISSRDRDGPPGRGFAQAYGYFEMKAKLPGGGGLWPAFWLIGVDKTTSASEIDVMEDYGGFPEYYHCVAHIWRKSGKNWSKDFLIHVPRDILSKQYNLFGVLIGSQTTRFTFNRRIVAEMPTPPEYRQPFYVLADLALGGGWSTASLSSPQTMKIASISAYAPPAGAQP